DDQLDRRLDGENRFVKFFDRPDAEAAGQLQDDRAIAAQALRLLRCSARFLLRENWMDGNAGDADLLDRNAPVREVSTAFFRRGGSSGGAACPSGRRAGRACAALC